MAIALTVAALMFPASSSATLINLSFAGQVDNTGAKIGGVSAPIGSPFTLDIVIDDTNAALGSYGIQGISYTTSIGTYTTISNWVQPLVATQNGLSINLSGNEINATTEHFFLNLTNFGPSLFNDPLTWTGAAITGDIYVRGIGGYSSPDQLSGGDPYTGTLSVSTAAVPEPTTLALLSLGLVGLGFSRGRRKA